MIKKFEILDTFFGSAKLIQPFQAYDERGSFTKDYSKEALEQLSIHHDLKEVFYTESFKGVIRAIHFQRVHEQPKLVRCVSGHVYDVIVDLRPSSPTFGQWKGVDLTGQNHLELLIPEHFGHGYLVLENSIVSYKCSEKFWGEYDDGICWNDKEIGISWPLELVNNNIILSEKDKNLQSFKEFREKYCQNVLV